MPIEHITPDAVPSAGPPHLSIATGVSKIMFVSGQVGRRGDGSPAGDTLRSQATQAMKNLAAVVEGSGADPDHVHVAKTTVYVKDLRPNHLEEMLYAVGDFVEDGGQFEFTASTMVGVTSLYEPWCLVEIDAICVID